jgi:DNA-binding NtrC family response regulator
MERKLAGVKSMESSTVKKTDVDPTVAAGCGRLNSDPTSSVLIVDDDQEAIGTLLGMLARKGIPGTVAETSQEALNYVEKNETGLVFKGVYAEKLQEGFAFVRRMASHFPELPVVIMGRFPELQAGNCQPVLDAAIQFIHAGCRHFLVKPVNRGMAESLVDAMLPNQAVAMADFAGTRNGIVGKSPALLHTLSLAKKVAATTVSVLVSGESGTGKELVASLIHHHSRRAAGPYMKVNCAALNDSLIESELFGHEKGAFTGAHSQRKGRFEMAHGGTLLLDEITETPLKFQATLLRVLEQQDFERVGGNDNIRVDVRILSTTNKDLAEEVAMGRFRQDLYYRLNGVRLQVPPLRQRSEDLPELVWYFVNLYARQADRHITSLSPEMMELFSNYPWPGNIRQLRNVVRTSLILGTGPVLSLADASWLFDELLLRPQKEVIPDAAVRPIGGTAMPLAQVERQAILDVLEQTSGNQTKAAKILGISDRTLRGKIRQYRQQETLLSV